jgi:ferredoxin
VSESRTVVPGAARRASIVGNPGPGWVLRIDPVLCDGIGICSHLAADLVRVDSWGYPIVSHDGLDDRELRQAQAAITACPRHALFLSPPR